MWRDRNDAYGITSIALHWLVAAGVVGLFALGVWMVTLTYYHPWYNTAPDMHRSLGILLLAVLAARFGWRLAFRRPASVPGHARWERGMSRVTHWALNLLTLLVIVAGYFISTAGGNAIRVFDWFTVPALFDGIPRQASLAGVWHKYLAWALIILASLHALAALKHHFMDRDRTLTRILKPERTNRPVR